MPLSFNEAMLEQLKAAQSSYTKLLEEAALEKEGFQRRVKFESAEVLYEQIIKLEKRCEQRGIIPMNLAASKKSITQLQVFQPAQVFR